MGQCGSVWVSVGGCIWSNMAWCGSVWLSVGQCGSVWVSVDQFGSVWVGVYGLIWLGLGQFGGGVFFYVLLRKRHPTNKPYTKSLGEIQRHTGSYTFVYYFNNSN